MEPGLRELRIDLEPLVERLQGLGVAESPAQRERQVEVEVRVLDAPIIVNVNFGIVVWVPASS